jgi:hypothetical protein
MPYKKESEEPIFPPKSGPHSKFELAATKLRLAFRCFWKMRAEECSKFTNYLDNNIGLLLAFLAITIPILITIFVVSLNFFVGIYNNKECRSFCDKINSDDSSYIGYTCHCIRDGEIIKSMKEN